MSGRRIWLCARCAAIGSRATAILPVTSIGSTQNSKFPCTAATFVPKSSRYSKSASATGHSIGIRSRRRSR
uniref:Putative secreted peptide n=1 Tax=Anopheles braziliensis TaxID=58242 RepID=A0A2M3ZWA3_9DIPT